MQSRPGHFSHRKKRKEGPSPAKGLALLALALLLLVCLGPSPLGAFPLPAYNKAVPRGYGNNLDPNVLLLIDTSGSMTFSTRTGADTYGDGGHPVRLPPNSQSNESWQYMYGRDLDPSNNDPTVPYSYHENMAYISDEVVARLDSYQKAQLAMHGGKYLHPNDSRLYNLKLVLHEIFKEKALVDGLRLALATFDQKYFKNGRDPDSNFYRRPTRSWWWGVDWVNQKITEVGVGEGDYAKLRVDFADDNASSLKEYFDGEESADNRELRANGATPLGNSLYLSGKNPSPCARTFFEKSGVISGWCQANYVIVLADGDDSFLGADDLVRRTQQLYNVPLNMAKIHGKSLQPVKLFVIGLAAADSLRTTLNRMADMGWDGFEDGKGPRGDGSEQAFFADDVPSLLQAFQDIFGLIQDKRGVGSAPLVSPPSPMVDEGSTYLASFIPSTERVWTGKLSKRELDGEGRLGRELWEAGGKLDLISPASRKIVTVDWSGSAVPKLVGTNMARFESGQASRLADEMLPSGASSANLGEFIDWACGGRMTGDPGEGDRWKLGDMYHGGLVEVGPPGANTPDVAYRAFADDNRGRSSVVYVQANDGMLHAFEGDSGTELWAFIPPNVLASHRLAAQVLNAKGNVAHVAGRPLYLLDGPLVAEDLPYEKEAGKRAYRTLLVGASGYGGQGLYALDVTDPERPKFLWAVENDVYKLDDGEVELKKASVLSWLGKSSGPSASLSENAKDYRAYGDYLRLTVGTPFLGQARVEGAVKSLVFVAAGLPHPPVDDDDDGGRAVFLIDAATGRVEATLFDEDEKLGVVQSPISALAELDGTSFVRRIYFGDGLGQIFEGDLSSWPPTLNPILAKGKGEASSMGFPYAIEIGLKANQTWLFAGMGDPRVIFEGDSVRGDNYFVAVNRSRVTGEAIGIDDLQELGKSDANSVNTDPDGWYIKLDGGEIITTVSLLYRGALFFATYRASADPCTVGDSRFYVLDAYTGRGLWGGGKKYVDLKGWVITGISVAADRVFLAGTDHSQGADSLPDEMGDYGVSGNLIAGPVPAEVLSQGGAMTPGVIRPLYWRGLW